jgi:hypothetical protein
LRKDMKHLLLDTGRVGGHGKAESRRARIKRADPDDLPSWLPSSRQRQFGYDGKEQTDRLAPLQGFLEKNCGRQWDDVYSEICEHADPRAIRGFHLRQHVWQYVIPNNYDVGHRRSFGPFFVDVDGTLQKEKPHIWPHHSSSANPRLVYTVDLSYEKIEGIWYRFTTEHFTQPCSREDLVEENGEVKIVRITLPDDHRTVTTKQQVDGATQKELDETWTTYVSS